MIWPIYALYVVTVALIRISKWIELQLFKLFTPIFKKQGQKLGSSIGVIFHCEKDGEWTQSDNELALQKCSEKYNTLVHFNVHKNSFFPSVANMGMWALNDAFLDGTFTCTSGPEDITEFSMRMMENNMYDLYYHWWNKTLEWLELYAFNLQTKKRAFQVGKVHYDLGNQLFQNMLDPWMQYTCGYWKDVDNLNDAQINKMELIARKLDLKPGMRVLDIGCGWGTLCKYLAEKYKVECVGVTIGEQGVIYGKDVCKGLPVDIRLQDYRDVNEQFDRIVSVGMFEHVGFRNYREFFKVVRRCLKDDGIFLLHTIGRNHANILGANPVVHHYIFPNGFLPDPEHIINATKNLFVIEDWHNFGADYAKTLNAWRDNFINGWPQIQDSYDEKFYRLWIFYLSSANGMFKSRRGQLWQIVFSKDGLKGGYRAAR